MERRRKPLPELVVRGYFNEDGLAVSWDWHFEHDGPFAMGSAHGPTLAVAQAQEALRKWRNEKVEQMVAHADIVARVAVKSPGIVVK